jgi:hypothetical protein
LASLLPQEAPLGLVVASFQIARVPVINSYRWIVVVLVCRVVVVCRAETFRTRLRSAKSDYSGQDHAPIGVFELEEAQISSRHNHYGEQLLYYLLDADLGAVVL